MDRLYTRAEIVHALRYSYEAYRTCDAHMTDRERITAINAIDEVASYLGITADEFEQRTPEKATEYKQ